MRSKMVEEKVNDESNTKTRVLPKPGSFSRFALLTKKDNVKIARRKQKQAIERIAKLKCKLQQ